MRNKRNTAELAINSDLSPIEKEIKILKESNSEKIVRYIDHFVENCRMFIVTEYYKVRKTANF